MFANFNSTSRTHLRGAVGKYYRTCLLSLGVYMTFPPGHSKFLSASTSELMNHSPLSIVLSAKKSLLILEILVFRVFCYGVLNKSKGICVFSLEQCRGPSSPSPCNLSLYTGKEKVFISFANGRQDSDLCGISAHCQSFVTNKFYSFFLSKHRNLCAFLLSDFRGLNFF